MNVFRVVCTIGLLLSAAAPVLAAQVSAPSADDKLQAACYPDIEKLCKDAMPDEDKITTCMKAHKAQVSQKCTDAYKASGRTD